ncbi:hypothetical protein CAOG_03807 [Capsaspora owczarzaki ATCC 30864]|uniref:Uncharacterized protein n=1 Tax=Capsaspora owczarzaki (strain ATCC 30864) TaxID=595528 RepID=A0A0D2WNU3_CAPO3|nr:hypothetical protein CAOG_03807 [Capsaspora owczarzaki ATCC 30864]KJE92925.1 hypothetical protein CAOG_003807 [Capsaspora owczarzaki ATCC 30864]|eukprot:XP_004363535.2 hypothetical protein CAOG_03807 [Capsaspora owczarzaki ATCC 30864]
MARTRSPPFARSSSSRARRRDSNQLQSACFKRPTHGRPFIEDFKANHPAAHLLAAQLVRSDCDVHAVATDPMLVDQVRQFGLHTLEECVRSRWNSYDTSLKDEFKTGVLELLATGMRSILNEPLYIKEKLAQVIVELAKRDWPQRWPTFFDELPELSKIGPFQTLVTLMILRTLAQDTMEFNDDLPLDRKRDLHNGMAAAMDNIFPYFVDIMTTRFSEYSLYMQSGNASQPEGEIALILCRAALMAIAAYLPWMKSTGSVACRLIPLLASMLNARSGLDLAVTECFGALVERHVSTAERMFVLDIFNHMDSFAAVLAYANATGTNESFVLLKRVGQVSENGGWLFKSGSCTDLAQILSALATEQLCPLINSGWKVENITYDLTPYLGFMLEITNHPSLILSSFTIPMWLAVMRHKVIRLKPDFVACLPSLVQALGMRLRKTPPYIHDDFDRASDHVQFFSVVRSRTSEALRFLSDLAPEIVISTYVFGLEEVMASPIDAGNATGLCTSSSPSGITWDALYLFGESVVRNFDMHAARDANSSVGSAQIVNQLMLALKGVTEELLMYQTNDPHILGKVLSLLGVHVCILLHAPELVPMLLAKIIAGVSFRVEPLPARLDEESLMARRRACVALVKLSSAAPELLLPHFDGVLQQVQQLIADGQVNKFEQTFLLESLVLVSNTANDVNAQAGFLAGIFAPIQQQLNSETMMQACSSPTAFLTFLGLLNSDSSLNPEGWHVSQQGLINRGEYLTILSTLAAVARRIAVPADRQQDVLAYYTMLCGDVFKTAVPHLLAIIRTLHLMWSPEAIPAQLTPLLEPSESERDSLIGLVADDEEDTDDEQPDSQAADLDGFRHWLSSLREVTYKLLATVFEKTSDIYTVASLDRVLFSSIFAYLETMQVRHMRMMIKFFLAPINRHCPPQMQGEVFRAVLPPIFKYMQGRLSAEWADLTNQVTNGSSSLLNEESDETNLEVFRNKVLRELTREYIEYMGRTLFPRNEDNTGFMPSDLAIELFSQPELAETYLRTCMLCILCGDTQACHRAVGFALPALPLVLNQPALVEFVGGEFFQTVLQGMIIHPQHGDTEAELATLAARTYVFTSDKTNRCRESLTLLQDVTFDAIAV